MIGVMLITSFISDFCGNAENKIVLFVVRREKNVENLLSNDGFYT